MDQTLSGKVAAITGAASGIGLACARRLLDAGATVGLVDRDRAALDTLDLHLQDALHFLPGQRSRAGTNRAWRRTPRPRQAASLSRTSP